MLALYRLDMGEDALTYDGVGVFKGALSLTFAFAS